MFNVAPEKFAEIMIRAARNAGAGDWLYDADNFALNSPTGNKGTVFLLNAYNDYQAVPIWQRGSVVKGYLGMFADVPADTAETLDEARPHLLPRVRERMYHEGIRLQALADGEEPFTTPFRELATHLTLEVVYDMPHMVRSIPASDFGKWGITFDEAVTIALENLARIAGKRFEMPRPGVYVSAWRDAYDASRMATPDIFNALKLKGRPVVMVPNRDVLLVTGDEDAEGLAWIAKRASEVLEQPRPMSGFAYRLTSRWEPFLPPRDNPAFNALDLVATQQLIGHYMQQGDSLLGKIFERRNEDVYVGSLIAKQAPGGTCITISTWVKPVDTMLAEAKYIVFVGTGPDGKPEAIGAATWERVVAEAGDLMERTADYPPRYRVRQYPTAAQLERMNFSTLDVILESGQS